MMKKEEHAARIRLAIADAEADGMVVWIEKDCPDSSAMALLITNGRLSESDQMLRENQTVIHGCLEYDSRVTEGNPFA